MLRWILRLSTVTAAAVLALWAWQRYNENMVDTLEEDTDEVPVEFDVHDDAALAPSPYEQAQVAAFSAREDGAPVAPAATAGAEDNGSTASDLNTASADSAAGSTTLVRASADTAAGQEAAAEDNTALLTTTDAPDAPDAAPSGELHPDVNDLLNAPAPTDDPSGEAADAPEPTAPTTESPPGTGDNLMMIRGIGPKYGAQLAELGITTYGALINASVDTLKQAFPLVSITELEDWQMQALELQPAE